MKIKKWFSRLERIAEALLRVVIIGFIAAFLFAIVMCIGYIFPTSFLNPESATGVIFSYGTVILGCISILFGTFCILIFLTLSFVNPLTQEEIQRLKESITYHKSQIHSLRSDEWICIVKKSLGDKFDRIDSEQFLIDKRDNMIRYHQQCLDIDECQLDNR